MSDSSNDFDFVALHFRAFSSAIRGRGALFSGAYFLLVLAYLENGCKGLPDDDSALRRLSECEREEWDAIGPIICNREDGSFFKLEEDGLWHQKRAREEFIIAREKVLKIREQRSTAGKASGLARRAKPSLPPPKRPNGSSTTV